MSPAPSRSESGRTPAEWVTFAIAALVLAVVIGLAASRIGDDDPPDPVATLAGPAAVRGDRHIVTVAVHNHGDRTASDVVVTAELIVDGQSIEAEQTIAFLSGGDDEELVFVFDDDPAAGDLDVSVSGYGVP